jgi:lysophospholipase L1-like esterase
MDAPSRDPAQIRRIVPSRVRLVALRSALAIGTLLVLLVALEACARLYLRSHPSPARLTGIPDVAFGTFDPELGWVLKPNVHTRVTAEKFSYELSTSSRGLRGREHAYEHTPDTCRIVLLGDSVAWGWGVDDGLAFADLIERDLGPGVEVVNLSCPGYSTDQELWTLAREGRRYHPDVVMLAFVMNDVLGNEATGDKPRLVRSADGTWAVENQPVADSRIRFGHAGESWREELRSRSALAEVLLRSGAEDATGDGTEEKPPSERKARVTRTYDDICDEIADPQGRTHELLSRIAALCREMNARPLAFDVVHKHDRYLYEPKVAIPSGAPTSGFETRVTRRLREAGLEIGFETLSLDQALLDVVRTGTVLHCGDGHLNARGHEIVARELEKWIRADLDRRR